tara:strand:- start:7237 stop:7413 length:177 start_codon:yes stop_codon:yes gene_type:complete
MATRYRVWFCNELQTENYMVAEFYFQSALTNCRKQLEQEAKDRGMEMQVRTLIVEEYE